MGVSGLVTYNSASNTAIFTPSSNLAASTSYTATITTGAKDMFGNALASNNVWTFTTGVATCTGIGVPTVVSVTPADGACPDTAVTATFSEAMDSSTINATTFTLVGPGAAGTVSYDAPDVTATFSPSPAQYFPTSPVQSLGLGRNLTAGPIRLTCLPGLTN